MEAQKTQPQGFYSLEGREPSHQVPNQLQGGLRVGSWWPLVVVPLQPAKLTG